jgi:hypothetical protein
VEAVAYVFSLLRINHFVPLDYQNP